MKSAWIWTIQRKFILHFSIGSKATWDIINQIAHVPQLWGSLGNNKHGGKSCNGEIAPIWVEKAVIFNVDKNIPTHFKCYKQEENLTLFFQVFWGFKKMLDYIMNQSCD